ncbi:hypothetical protein [Paenibacillus albidus]|nr:hypothetical protein [Paenibacillus albidus]
MRGVRYTAQVHVGTPGQDKAIPQPMLPSVTSPQHFAAYIEREGI